jgi:S-DNA-T family DNA segregation ATPase FtsK/SpoIIIE
MGKEKTSDNNNTGMRGIAPKKRFWSTALLLVTAILSLISLFDYDPANLHNYPPAGSPPVFGQVGLFLGRSLLCFFGLSAWLIPWAAFSFAFMCWQRTPSRERFQKILPLSLVGLGVVLLGSIRDTHLFTEGLPPAFDQNFFENGAGGIMGSWLYSGLVITMPTSIENGGYLFVWLGEVGTTVIACISLFAGCTLFFSLKNETPSRILKPLIFWVRAFFGRSFFKLLSKKSAKGGSSREATSIPPEENKLARSEEAAAITITNQEDPLFGDVSLQKSEFLSANGKGKSKDPSKTDKKINVSKNLPPQNKELETEPQPVDAKPSLEQGSENSFTDPLPDSEEEMDGFKVVRPEKTEKAVDLFPERKGNYQFPDLNLLMDPPEEETSADEDHMIKARRLRETLAEFKIEVELGEVHTGPVITRYDIHPAAGVRVEKIANLDKNLAMALKADSVRILAPVPGKGCVGIEVPNERAAAVCLKEILQSRAWADAGAEIPIVLGKEASGKPLVADLTKMPHLLVAGSTGSGKTVCINAIIASLCYHSSPEDVRFIMVDPKIVEMKVYNDLPHMLIPVVTEPKKVPGALKWLLIEMERRYQIFSKVGVRNIAGFNAKILKDKEEKEKAQLLDAEMTAEERAALSSIQVPRDDDALEIPENKLPYIVCIIDELADLMMVAQADVETGIARLAQLARAAGIHLIIATQRPSVNVITGVIKANLPSRISFRVASYRDSQTILDGKGAESLIGKGDMLFIPPGSATFMRAQGAFVSDDEINGIVEFLKVNGPPQIIEEVRDQIESAGEEDVLGSSGENEDEDPMLKKAVEIIKTTKRASTSNLQRKLSIGYNRAARIMDELEERGIVGPDLPGQGREILIDV